MAIVLSEYNIPVSRKLIGDEKIDAVAGQSVKIETSPNGEELLDITVPAGKKWYVTLYVKIEETDA